MSKALRWHDLRDSSTFTLSEQLVISGSICFNDKTQAPQSLSLILILFGFIANALLFLLFSCHEIKEPIIRN